MERLARDKNDGNHEFPLRILQFGGGNFLRAFTGWMVEILNEETNFGGDIAVIKPTPGGSYRLLIQQQGLYHVLLNGIKDGREVIETKQIHCIREIVNPYTQWSEYLKLAELASFRFVISNTTEAGIRFDPDAQSNGKVPEGFPAKLCLWLHHRYQFFCGDKNRGCFFLPCELIEENGAQLYQCIVEHANSWGFEEGFIDWLKTANYFCNTLVDRIVSGFPDQAASDYNERLGVCDELLVSGEYYHSWVIDGPAILPVELPTRHTDLNVQFVEELKPYREMKVRILNGTHSLMVPVGCLMGFRFVHECMFDKDLSGFLETMIEQEICPTINLPEMAVRAFKQDTFTRFRNPFLNHRLINIALNSMAKFNTRVIPVLLSYFHKYGYLPPRIVLSMAAQFCFYRGRVDDRHIILNDLPQTLAFFKEIWEQYEASPDGALKLVSKVLANRNLWSVDLAGIPGLHEQLAGQVYLIESEGMSNALRSTKEG